MPSLAMLNKILSKYIFTELGQFVLFVVHIAVQDIHILFHRCYTLQKKYFQLIMHWPRLVRTDGSLPDIGDEIAISPDLPDLAFGI